MQLFLKGLENTKVFEVDITCTVNEFMDRIYNEYNIPSNTYMLINNAKNISDPNKNLNKYLTDYGITDLSTIELRFIIRNTNCEQCNEAIDHK